MGTPEQVDRQRPTREIRRLPRRIPSTCLGSACVYYSGVNCSATEELLLADRSVSTGTSLPPLLGEASWAIYTRICRGEAGPDLVSGERFLDLQAYILKYTVSPDELLARCQPYEALMASDLPPNLIELGASRIDR